MNAVHSLFSGLACCSNLQDQLEVKGHPDKGASFLITCFDEQDMELRDIKIHPTTTWAEMQICITDGKPATAKTFCMSSRSIISVSVFAGNYMFFGVFAALNLEA